MTHLLSKLREECFPNQARSYYANSDGQSSVSTHLLPIILFHVTEDRPQKRSPLRDRCGDPLLAESSVQYLKGTRFTMRLL